MSNKTTLLLVGRSGSGKSSVGNSILRKQEAFKASGMRQERMLSNEVASNDEFCVVDCSGVGDTGSDMVGDVKDVIRNARKALNKIKGVTMSEYHEFELVDGPANVENIPDSFDNRGGFDALIFVMKYGVRFTKQEKDAVQMVKSIFGENVFRDWGILVFSYGDNFKLDTEDDDINFENWCKEQTGDIKLLFEEVQDRCVLFDNKSTGNDQQLEELQKTIKSVTQNVPPYTLVDFDSAEMGRIKLNLKYQYGELQAKTDHLLAEANQLLTQLPPDGKQLQTALAKLSQLVEEMTEKDQGTGELKHLLQHLDVQVALIQTKMKQFEGNEEQGYLVTLPWAIFSRLLWLPELIISKISKYLKGSDQKNDGWEMC